ncbi:hypothetical protein Anacy_4675 [Anabaena cylindrica PCC 7122]|uniref:Uncharacterized protein n=1 Tax=Anabaena cylindrica (strain ATCC 27899 / PCC 7122) TaxID=272123 RepID=K9ZMK4_ANACC|nr:hypothetical protein Anacy_4675 [Anabaena cylindrica PCC 7122]BAY02914.1 hypothetical protein NIES19_21640 [Anabaena cylindrica PCC 7122]
MYFPVALRLGFSIAKPLQLFMGTGLSTIKMVMDFTYKQNRNFSDLAVKSMSLK